MTHNTDYYITKISKMSNKFGDKLIMLMDKYEVNSLREITTEQAKSFYEDLVKNSK